MIQVYGSETIPQGSTMLELHSNVAALGTTSTVDGVLPTQRAFHETLEAGPTAGRPGSRPASTSSPASSPMGGGNGSATTSARAYALLRAGSCRSA